MTKKELIKKIANQTKLSQKIVAEVLDSFLNELVNVVKSKDTLSIVGYLSVGTKKRSARTAINPMTKQKINIPAKNVAYIKVGSKIKDAVK